ncbi:unnamed protein product [Auanema sp. JU1783]|nr:unnamed protein product [Auanema sp. JU1783]
MDCFVGGQTGALKGINLREKNFSNLTSIKDLNPKKDEVTAMIWSKANQLEVLTAHLDRQLKVFDYDKLLQSSLFSVEDGTGPIKGVHLTPEDKIFTCVESGTLSAYTRTGEKELSFEVGPRITTMRGSNELKRLVTGGTKNLIKTWDMETGKMIWSSRNVHLDKLQLEVPVFCVDAQFNPKSEMIVEASKVHELRVYDPRTQRRPVKRINFMDCPITAMSFCNRENHVIAANAIGEMALFDLRSRVNPVYKYKGQAGSIRSISAHETEPYVASCGIDRFVRVHEVNTRKLEYKIYCKTRMNKILMSTSLSILKKEEEINWEDIKKEAVSDEEDDDEDDDDEEEAVDEKKNGSDQDDDDDEEDEDEEEEDEDEEEEEEEDEEEEDDDSDDDVIVEQEVPAKKRKRN